MIQFTSFQFIGRLTSDPELINTANGNHICKFRVATNKRIGKDEERTSFIPVVVFGRQAEICAEYLSKGREVFVTGEFETDEYTDKDGNKRTGFSCVVGSHGTVQFGSGGSKGDDEGAARPMPRANTNTNSVIREKLQDRGSARGRTRR
jgi:single-strand DNA-binding protein